MKGVALRFLSLLMLFLAFSWQGEAKVWSADDIPMVHLQDKNRYVCDPDGLMKPAFRDSADVYLRRMETECGVQSVFIVANQVKGGDCFRMAQDIGNKYGVGDKKTRRGLVVVIAVGDHGYFIAPGKGLEGDLTDIECNHIAQACIVKNMRQDDIDAAVLQTVKAVYCKLKTGQTNMNAGTTDTAEEEDDTPWPVIIFVLILCFAYPTYLFIRYILEELGLIKPRKRNNNNHRRNHDRDDFPPFFFGGFGGFGSGGGGGFSSGGSFGGGSFGGGSFGGGGAGGKW